MYLLSNLDSSEPVTVPKIPAATVNPPNTMAALNKVKYTAIILRRKYYGSEVRVEIWEITACSPTYYYFTCWVQGSRDVRLQLHFLNVSYNNAAVNTALHY